MKQLTIQVDSAEDEALVRQLLDRLAIRIVNESASLDERKKSLGQLMETLSQSGIGTVFGDPSEWQREIRSWDRVLDGREE